MLLLANAGGEPWRMNQVKWVVFTVPGRYFESLGLIIPWTSNA